MCFKTEDEIDQIRHYVKSYYMPLLSEFDLAKLQENYNDDGDVVVEKKLPTFFNPKQSNCSRISKSLILMDDKLPKMPKFKSVNMSSKDRLEMISEYSHKRFKVLDQSIKTIKREENEKKLEFKRMMFLIEKQKETRRVRQSQLTMPLSRSPDKHQQRINTMVTADDEDGSILIDDLDVTN